jgi:hypothetical protein
MNALVRPLRVLSLGAGVQSSTVALMMKHGEIEKADVMIFADTGAEPPSVYKYLGWLVAECAGHIPFLQVMHDDGLTKALESSARGERSVPCPPLFTLATDGSKGMLRRICTDRFKIRCVRKKCRQLLKWHGQKCITVRGISDDERHRAKPADVQWIAHQHPLCEMKMTRTDCKRWMVSKGYPIPPRSACVFCPYRCNPEWERMRTFEPEAWEEACRMDELMRTLKGINGKCYVHRQCVPLREAKIEDDTANRFPGSEGWGVECEGMCGV